MSTGWLVGIARHKLADHWRRAEREQRGLRLVHGSEPEADDPWEVQLDALLARQVLARLGPHHRAALTLRGSSRCTTSTTSTPPWRRSATTAGRPVNPSGSPMA